VNVVPLSARVDATVFTAIFLMEQPALAATQIASDRTTSKRIALNL